MSKFHKARAIGEVFEFEGHTLRVEKSTNEAVQCLGCIFFEHPIYKLRHCTDTAFSVTGVCLRKQRVDQQDVIFKEVTPETETVTLQLTKQQAAKLSEILWTTNDEGPISMGWPSEETVVLRDLLDAAIQESEAK